MDCPDRILQPVFDELWALEPLCMRASKPPPGLMSVEEIRWWLTELLDRGWGRNVLARTLGLTQERTLRAKASGKAWIYRTEQIRMSYVLKRIISGELVCINGKPGRGNAGNAVIADRPQPLRPGLHWHVDLRRGTAYLEPTEPPPTPLPNFRTLLENPRPWRKP